MIVKKVDGRVCQIFLSEKERVSVCDLSALKNMFQLFDQLVILSRSEERKEAAACHLKDEGCNSRMQSHQQTDKGDFPESQRDR